MPPGISPGGTLSLDSREEGFSLSIISGNDNNRRESQQAEANRRGISRYQVRLERFQEGLAADPRHILWGHLRPKQIVAIREHVPRAKWRTVVNKILEGQNYYEENGTGWPDFDTFWEDILGDDWRPIEYDRDESNWQDYIRWYHRTGR